MTDRSAFRDAEREADELAAAIEAGKSLDPAYTAIEQSLEKVRASGLPVESLLPAGERRLGFSLKQAKSGKSFWDVYAAVLRKKLCTSKSKLRTLANTGAGVSASALVGLIASTLALPVVAASMASAFAAIIATSGIDAFCEFTKPKKPDGAPKTEKSEAARPPKKSTKPDKPKKPARSRHGARGSA